MLRVAPLLVLVATALGTVACHRVRVEEVRGPDGSEEWKKLSCKRLDRKCYAVAKKLCPNGYYFAKNPVAVRGEPDRDEARRTSAAPDKRGSTVKTLPPQEQWGSEMYSRRRGELLVRCAEDAT
jgi:hypothetical protein